MAPCIGPRSFGSAALVPAMILLVLAWLCPGAAGQEPKRISLPTPLSDGGKPVTRALTERQSVRDFAGTPLRLADVAQLLWAAQGVTRRMTDPRPGWRAEWGEWRGGLRTAPSAGALYPLEIYLLAASVQGLDAGLYRYIPLEHALLPVGKADRAALAKAALDQPAVSQAPAVMIVSGVYQRTAAKYGERASRYVHIEVGAAAENLMLQASALGLGSVFMGAFRDDAVRDTLRLPADHAPLGLVPVGYPRGK